jgi:hypothetical protein
LAVEYPQSFGAVDSELSNRMQEIGQAFGDALGVWIEGEKAR